MHHCHSRQLRAKTMLSYEQTLKLFGVWLADTTTVTRVEDIREKHIRAYMVELQERGKYTQVADRKAQKYNCPQNRRDYCGKISNTTINNYIRNLKAYFAWLVEMEMLTVSPLRRVKPLPEERKPKESDKSVANVIALETGNIAGCLRSQGIPIYEYCSDGVNINFRNPQPLPARRQDEGEEETNGLLLGEDSEGTASMASVQRPLLRIALWHFVHSHSLWPMYFITPPQSMQISVSMVLLLSLLITTCLIRAARRCRSIW